MKTENKQDGFISGTAASSGVAKGLVRIIQDEKDFSSFQAGEVLVAKITNPIFTPIIFLACAIVTDVGSRLSHAAIVARELGIPAVVGTENATKVLKDGDIVVVDGSKGVVHLLT
ncbi:MAG: PEP-utilizing enzyme [Patescibacteria group bacterium]